MCENDVAYNLRKVWMSHSYFTQVICDVILYDFRREANDIPHDLHKVWLWRRIRRMTYESFVTFVRYEHGIYLYNVRFVCDASIQATGNWGWAGNDHRNCPWRGTFHPDDWSTSVPLPQSSEDPSTNCTVITSTNCIVTTSTKCTVYNNKYQLYCNNNYQLHCNSKTNWTVTTSINCTVTTNTNFTIRTNCAATTN